jgi:hypothetical protein
VKVPKEIRIIISSDEHELLKSLKDEAGLLWREVLYKAFDLPIRAHAAGKKERK